MVESVEQLMAEVEDLPEASAMDQADYRMERGEDSGLGRDEVWRCSLFVKTWCSVCGKRLEKGDYAMFCEEGERFRHRECSVACDVSDPHRDRRVLVSEVSDR